MSDLDFMPRVRVDLEGQEAQRQDADAINRLISETASQDDRLVVTESLLAYLILVSREFGLLSGQVGAYTNGDIIDGWDIGVVAHADSQMVIDAELRNPEIEFLKLHTAIIHPSGQQAQGHDEIQRGDGQRCPFCGSVIPDEHEQQGSHKGQPDDDGEEG